MDGMHLKITRRLKVTNKKRFRAACVITVAFTALILSLFSNLFKESDKDTVAALGDKVEYQLVTLTSSNKGNIFFEENEFFKKYIIKCLNEQTKIDYTENNKEISINFQKDLNLELNNSAFTNIENKDIYKKEKDTNILSIKKNYSNNNFIFIDDKDKSNVIVLISKLENPFKYKVLLDAGHGGIDKGVNIDDIYEKDINLKIVKYMVNDLRFNGCDVKLSRDSDVLNALKDIADMGNQMNVDALVSIHINSFKDSKYSGVGTYYTDNGSNLEERIRLAKTIQKYAINDDGWVDRGLFKDKLKILSYSQGPCVLVECGFLTNPSDRDRLTREEPLQNLAKNISNGIVEFLQNKK
jgi:N-acetylmuramoyl-L-alanine amidase